MTLSERTATPTDVDKGVTAVVLAGGRGQRMGSVDKGLVLLRGQPMVLRVLDRIAPQVDDVLINANRNIDAHGAFGYPVVMDAIGGFLGPLAGLHAGMSRSTQELVVSVPCDSPYLPMDLVARLHASLERHGAQIAVAQTFNRSHPVFALVRTAMLPHLTQFLDGGGRKIDAWHATLDTIGVAFDDEADAFCNINTADDLNRAAAQWDTTT